MKKKIIDFIGKYDILMLILCTFIFECIVYSFPSINSNYVKIVIILAFLFGICTCLIITCKKNPKKKLLYLIYSMGVVLRTIYILYTTIYERA